MRKIVLLVLVALLCVAGSESAFAKKRGGFIPIPGFRSSEIVKVIDLPDIGALQRDDGIFVDLGYKFDALGGGEWVGYLGNSSNYLSLDPPMLDLLLMIGGLDAPPPVPARPASSLLTTFAVIGLGGFGLLVILTRILGGVFRRNRLTFDDMASELDTQCDMEPYGTGSAAPLNRVRTMTQHQQFTKRTEFGRRGL